MDVCLRGVMRIQHSADPTLGVLGAALRGLVLGNDCHGPILGHLQRVAQASYATAQDQEVEALDFRGHSVDGGGCRVGLAEGTLAAQAAGGRDEWPGALEAPALKPSAAGGAARARLEGQARLASALLRQRGKMESRRRHAVALAPQNRSFSPCG